MLNPSSDAPSSPSLETSSTEPLRRSTCGPSAARVATEDSPTIRTRRPIARTVILSTPLVLTGLVRGGSGSLTVSAGAKLSVVCVARCGRSVLTAHGSTTVSPDAAWALAAGSAEAASSSFVGSRGASGTGVAAACSAALSVSMRRAASAASMRPAARSSKMAVMRGSLVMYRT